MVPNIYEGWAAPIPQRLRPFRLIHAGSPKSHSVGSRSIQNAVEHHRTMRLEHSGQPMYFQKWHPNHCAIHQKPLELEQSFDISNALQCKKDDQGQHGTSVG